MPAHARVEVPVRVCDVGGWTDTWFARSGAVCSLAVGPAVTVEARAEPGDGSVAVDAADYGCRFTIGSEPPAHRLLGAAVTEAGSLPGRDVVLTIRSAVPPGTSVGTSAAVAVGVIAVLDALRGGLRPAAELAAAAHRAEAVRLGRQCGVQDQIAAAHGGANLIDIDDYPHATARPLELDAALQEALDERLAHVAYGSAHDSSAVHEQVIALLEAEGETSARLERLRGLAGDAATALEEGDLARYGSVLTASTRTQEALHPDLVSAAAQELIELADRGGALGWKVNGAAGPGGSISVLCRRPSDRERFLAGAAALGHRPLDLRLSPLGARIDETGPPDSRSTPG